MADTVKKYADQEAIQALITKVKEKDTETLASANSYADSLASNYDVAGAANTAETNAKGYTDAQVKALADGQVTTNKNNIAAIKNDYLKAADKAELQGNIDALDTYVGNIPETSSATDVIDYINEKTSGIATDAALAELQAKVNQAETDIDAIEADYLKEADKTELSNAITAETSRAGNIEAGLRTDVDAIKDDYVTKAEKATLAANIQAAQDAANAAKTHSEGVASNLATAKTTLEDADKAQVNRIKSLEDQIVGLSGAMHFEGIKNEVPGDVSGYESGDVIIVGNKEYVFNGTEFAEFGDVTAESQAITALQDRMGTAESDIDTLEAELASANAEIAKKAAQTDLSAEITARTNADTALGNRITTLETAIGDSGSVATDIATAKQEAIDAAAADATTKANQALTDAKKYADDEDAKIETRVDALEADTHTHANKALLDTYTQTEANLADAVAKKHEHGNATVLDGITAEKVAAWDASEQNAKTYADGLNTAMTTKVDDIETKVDANTTAISTKASQADLATLTDRVTVAEAGVAANKTAIEQFVAISADEIHAMFA